jgi:hypothetical protein
MENKKRDNNGLHQTIARKPVSGNSKRATKFLDPGRIVVFELKISFTSDPRHQRNSLSTRVLKATPYPALNVALQISVGPCHPNW